MQGRVAAGRQLDGRIHLSRSSSAQWQVRAATRTAWRYRIYAHVMMGFDAVVNHGIIMLCCSDEGRLEGRVISSPAILISPRGAEAGVGEGEGVTEGGEGGAAEKEKLICVDGDNIELSGPLLIRYIKVFPSLLPAPTPPLPAGPSDSVLLRQPST